MNWLHLFHLISPVILTVAFTPSPPCQSHQRRLQQFDPYHLRAVKDFDPLRNGRPYATPDVALSMSSNGDGNGDEDESGSETFNERLQDSLNNNLLLPTSILTATAALASFGTLWSEYSVIITGCGPRILPDAVERGCYLGVLVIAGLSVFLRIVTWGNGLATVIGNNIDGQKHEGSIFGRDSIVVQIKVVEWLSLLAVAGAFVALSAQTINGEQMDGLSGINEDMCKALQQLDN